MLFTLAYREDAYLSRYYDLRIITHPWIRWNVNTVFATTRCWNSYLSLHLDLVKNVSMTMDDWTTTGRPVEPGRASRNSQRIRRRSLGRHVDRVFLARRLSNELKPGSVCVGRGKKEPANGINKRSPQHIPIRNGEKCVHRSTDVRHDCTQPWV